MPRARDRRLAAARLEEARAIVDHKLYWATASSVEEAQFLTAILNTAEITERVRPFQSRGEFGPRDFDKAVFNVAIPLFDPEDAAHRALVELGARSEVVAAGTDVEGVGFQAARRRVRNALDADGVAEESEAAVRALIG